MSNIQDDTDQLRNAARELQEAEITIDEFLELVAALVARREAERTKWIIEHMDDMQEAWKYATPPSGMSYLDYMLNYIEGHAALTTEATQGEKGEQ